MTTAVKHRIMDAAIASVLTFIGTIFLLIFTGAWGLKENAADHKADIALVIQMQQRTLDAVCDAAKNAPRACKAGVP